MCPERIVSNMRGVLRRHLKTHGSEAVGRFFDGLSRSRVMIPHGKKATIGGMIVITVPIKRVGRQKSRRPWSLYCSGEKVL
jgi:hypothetical protein